jgi:murein DD-endopeptidase MepM/ murein hydrolase activator NlpD
MAASGMLSTVEEPGRGLGTVWHTLRVRVRFLLALPLLALVVGVAAAPARQTAAARAQAAVVTGSLGSVASVHASGDASTGRSAPSTTPDGIQLGGGSVSVTTSKAGGDASATAEAEAAEVDLLDGAVTARAVRRTATDTGSGVRYGGTVSGLKVGGKAVAAPRAGERYPLPDGSGYVVVSALGKGLELTLTGTHGSFPPGTDVVVADVSAHARDGAVAQPTATPTATATPRATATPTATRTPKPKATSTPSGPLPPEGAPRGGTSYKKRLMGRQFLFPVRGRVTIGGPFGGFRADTGFHEGNDIFANFGTPVVAVADGTVHKVGSLPISGNRLWVVMDNGDSFFYAHLSAFSPAAVTGTHVTAGTVLGYVGNTGDAEPTPPHLHFEIHPFGGPAVDPHPFLERWLSRAGDLSAVAVERPGALVEVHDFIGNG